MEKSREQFEKLAKNNGFTLDMTRGCYSSRDTRMAWDVWKASRESLEIELPPKQEMLDDYDMYEIGFNIAVNRLKEILINNGVKVK